MEYCRYIFSSLSDSDVRAYSGFKTKEEFMDNINQVIAFRKKIYGNNKEQKAKKIEEKKCNYILFNKIKELVKRNKILGGKKPDGDIKHFIENIRGIIRMENERIKRKEDINENVLLNLIYDTAILTSNAILTYQSNANEVVFDVYDFNAKDVFNYIRDIDHINKNPSPEISWLVSTCEKYTFLIPSVVPMAVGMNRFEKNLGVDTALIAAAGFPAVAAANMNEINAMKDFWSDIYFFFCLIATEIYIRKNNEVSGNVW